MSIHSMCFYAEKEKYEPAHDKTYNKACVTSKDSDQPVHLCSLMCLHCRFCRSLAHIFWIYIRSTSGRLF